MGPENKDKKSLERRVMKETSRDIYTTERVILISLVFGLFYWVFEAVLDSLIFQKGSFLRELYILNPYDLWMRIMVTVLFIFFNFYVRFMIVKGKQAKEKLKESKNAYLTLAENLPGIVYRIFLRENNRMMFFNNMLQTMTGYGSEELLSGEICSIEPLIVSEDRGNVVATVKKAVREDQPFEVEYRVRHKNGKIIYFYERGKPIQGTDGNPLYIDGVIFDITNRKQAEEEVRESEKKYSTLVEQAKDGVIITQEGVCKFVNKAMSQITGYSVADMQGKPLAEILASDCIDLETQKSKPCCLKNGRATSPCETKIRCKDGTVKEIEVSTGDIQFNNKNAVMGIVRDITERKRIAEELQKARKLEFLEIFAGGIAHDFNNILASVMGNLSLARRHSRSGDLFSDKLAKAEKAVARARGLSRQLMTFSKGGMPIKKAVSLSRLLKDAADFAFSGSEVNCQFSLPDNLWVVEIDEGQISQVINNLLINAQQAMSKGGQIQVSAENVMVGKKDNLPIENGKYVKVAIQDEGVGIRENHLKAVFDPYFTTKKRGSGLGLAIAYTIIQKHNGYIFVESTTGIGTTFSFYLPVSDKELFVVEDVQKEEFIFGKGKILLMDDQQSIREIVGDMLLDLGYKVTLAVNGTEAVTIYKEARESKNPFDVVMLDLAVPGGIGAEETLQKMQTLDPEVKAIILSGYANDPIMSQYKEYGFIGAIAKPFDMKELGEILRQVMSETKDKNIVF